MLTSWEEISYGTETNMAALYVLASGTMLSKKRTGFLGLRNWSAIMEILFWNGIGNSTGRTCGEDYRLRSSDCVILGIKESIAPHGTGVWKHIRSYRGKFTENCGFLLGNGWKIRFWKVLGWVSHLSKISIMISLVFLLFTTPW